jgi:hypothetical protein
MSRYGNGDDTIARLKAEAHVADQVVEDLSRALEDSERVSDRYREALVHIDQVAADSETGAMSRLMKISFIVKDAVWTKVDR